MSESSIYKLYLSNNPQVALKISPKKDSKNKNADKNFLNNWNNITTQWLKWLQDSTGTQPSTVPLIETRFLRPGGSNNSKKNMSSITAPAAPAVPDAAPEVNPQMNNTVGRVAKNVATTAVVETAANMVETAAAAAALVGGDNELERLKSDFTSWSLSSPYQFNIGTPSEMDKNLFEQMPKLVNPQYVGMTRKMMREWSRLRILSPPDLTNQDRELIFNQVVKAWHGDSAPYLALSMGLETLKTELVESYKNTILLLNIPQTDNVKFYNELRTWRTAHGFVNLIAQLEQITSFVQQSGLKGEQVDKLQKQASAILEKARGVASRSNSRSGSSSGIGGLFSELDSIYKQAEQEARQQSRSSSSYGYGRYNSGSTVNQGKIDTALTRLLLQKGTLLTQVREYFRTTLGLWVSSLLYVWLVSMQVDFIYVQLFWKSFCMVCASKVEAKQGTWNFVYSWNAKRWEERVQKWREIDITWIPSFDDTTKIPEMASHSWRNLALYIPANEKKNTMTNWWDMMLKGIISTEPLWGQLWNWGGWIEPTRLDEPVNWQTVSTVRYWTILNQEVQGVYQKKIMNSKNTMNEQLTDDDRLNRLLRWEVAATVDSSIQTILDWSNAVQKWKQEILAWRQRYNMTQNKKSVWEQFNVLIGRIVSLQKTWWSLHDRLGMGSLDQRVYWNYWWDLQRFYLEYFYFSGTTDEETRLYQNSFRYNYDIGKMLGGATPDGRYYLSTLMKNSQYSKVRGEINKLISAPSYELMRAVDGSNDIVFKWQAQNQAWIRSLDVMSLWSPSWNFWSYWQKLFMALGVWDMNKKQTTAYVFLPVRIGSLEYWINLEQLWRQLDSDSPVITGLNKPAAGLSIFMNYSELARAMLIRQQVRRKQEGAISTEISRQLPEDWRRLFAANTGVVKSWRIIDFTQEGVTEGVWLLDKMVDINPKQQQLQQQNVLQLARQQHPLIWVNWVARLLLGHSMPFTSQAITVDMSQRRPVQQPVAATRGGAGMLWSQQVSQVIGVLEQELKNDRHLYGFGPIDADVLMLNKANGRKWWQIDTQGDVKVVGGKGDDSKMRRWMLEQEMTGAIYEIKRGTSKSE